MRSPFVNLEEMLMSANFAPSRAKTPIQLSTIPEQNIKQDAKQDAKSFANSPSVQLNSSSSSSTNKLDDKYIWCVSILIILGIVVWGVIDMCTQRTRMLRIEKMLSMLCNKHGIMVVL